MNLEELEATLPWGLHDAYLERLQIDWPEAKLVLDVRVMITEHQDMDQRALITITGLVFCSVDPPEIDLAHGYEPTPVGGLWIDSGVGPANEDSGGRLPRIPDGCFLNWLFVHQWNRFIHICGRNAYFAWLEPAPVPSRSATRALFPGEVVPDPGLGSSD
jgi:hypothetical protein